MTSSNSHITAPLRKPAFLIYGVLFGVLPGLFLAAVHPWSIATFSLLAFVAAAVTLWRTRHTVPLSPVVLALLLLCAYALFQLVSLPSGLLGLVAPVVAELRVVVAKVLPDVSLWGPISLAPDRTSLAVVRMAGLGALALGAATLAGVGKRKDNRPGRLLIVAAWCWLVGGVIQVIIGVGQTVFFGGKGGIFGVITTTRPQLELVTGTFVNPNHAGTYLLVAAVVGLGLTLELRGRLRWAVLSAALICAIGVVLTGSRGAILGGTVALGLFAIHTLVRPPVKTDRSVISLVAGVMLVIPIVATVLLLSGAEIGPLLATRLGLDFEEDSFSKLVLIREGARTIGDYWLAGLGADAFGVASGPIPRDAVFRFAFVESDPIELLVCFGVFVGGAALVLFGWALWAAARAGAAAGHALQLAAVYGLIGFVIHSLVSFNLEILGLMMPLLLLHAGLKPGPLVSLSKVGRFAPLGLFVLFALIGGLHHLSSDDPVAADARPEVLAEARPADGRVLARVVLKMLADDNTDLEGARRLAEMAALREPHDPVAWLAAARVAVRQERFEAAAASYRKAQQLNPATAQPIIDEVLASMPTRKLQGQAITPNPDVLRALVVRLVKSGRVTEGLELMTVMFELHPDDPQVAAKAAFMARNANQPVLSELFGRGAIACCPKESHGYLATSLALAKQGRSDQAIKILDVGIEQTNETILHRTRALLIVGTSEPSQAQLLVAEESLDHLKIHGRGAQRAETHYLRGRLYEHRGESTLARYEYLRAARLEPDNKRYQRKARKFSPNGDR